MTTDDDRVNIEQSASGRLEGRVLQLVVHGPLYLHKSEQNVLLDLSKLSEFSIKSCIRLRKVEEK